MWDNKSEKEIGNLDLVRLNDKFIPILFDILSKWYLKKVTHNFNLNVPWNIRSIEIIIIINIKERGR